MLDFYHGTTTKVIDSIKRDGLIPGRGEGGYEFAKQHGFGIAKLDAECGGCRSSVYLTTNEALARDFAERTVTKVQKGGKPVVVHVRLPAREMARLVIDGQWADTESERWGNGFRYPGVIKPSWIKGVIKS